MINETDLEAWGYYKDSTLYKDMTLSSYQKAAAGTAIYETQHAIIYPALGLAGEAGEVANKVKKLVRDGPDKRPETWREDIASEIGDVLWYLSNLANDIGYNLDEIADINIEKLTSRKNRDKIKGSGDNR